MYANYPVLHQLSAAGLTQVLDLYCHWFHSFRLQRSGKWPGNQTLPQVEEPPQLEAGSFLDRAGI